MINDQYQLCVQHVEERMRCDIHIASESRHGDSSKSFVYNPLANEYRIYLDGRLLGYGQNIEAMIDTYNDLMI